MKPTYFLRLSAVIALFLLVSAQIIGCGGGTRGTETGERSVNISGVILDEAGEPVPNLSVEIPGEGLTTTDSEGQFSIELNENQLAPTLSISNGETSAETQLNSIPEGVSVVLLSITVSTVPLTIESVEQNNIVSTATATATPHPTAVPTQVPTATSTPSPIPTATPSPVPTSTSTSSPTPSPTSTETGVPVPGTLPPTETPTGPPPPPPI